MSNSSESLISVIIPTYNQSRYLGRAIKFIYDQTYGNWKAIIVDNHSTDDTCDDVKKFDDPRVSYLKIHNQGTIAAFRNMGINVAKGNWLAFLDSDDWWSVGKLTPNQRDETEKRLSYVSGRFNYLKKEYTSAALALKKALLSKITMITVKAITMFAIIFVIKKL